MIVAVANQESALLLMKNTRVPFFPKPDHNFDEREKRPARGFAVRVKHNGDLLAAQLGNHARLQVAHLQRALTPIQPAHQSVDDRAFAGPIGAKKNDFQFEFFLYLKRLLSFLLARSASVSMMATYASSTTASSGLLASRIIYLFRIFTNER